MLMLAGANIQCMYIAVYHPKRELMHHFMHTTRKSCITPEATTLLSVSQCSRLNLFRLMDRIP